MTDDTPTERIDVANHQAKPAYKHNVNESSDKIRLSVDLTRGNGTRDQEKHKLKARGETPAKAAENLSEALKELEERDVFERAREVENDD